MSNDANEIINSLITQVNAVTFRLYSLEKILTKLHSEKKLKGAVAKADKEIEGELQERSDQEAQDTEGEVGNNDNRGDDSSSVSGHIDGEDEVSSEQTIG